MPNKTSASCCVLVLRLSLGAMFIAHAALKFMAFALPDTVQLFLPVVYPGSLAFVVTFVEFVGGILIILHVYARWIALALIPMLLGVESVHWWNGWMISAPNDDWEYPVYIAVTAFALYLLCDGPFALRPSKYLGTKRAAVN